MHNALNTRKIAFHEHWKGDMREWRSENADFFLYSEGLGYWGSGKFLRVLDLDSLTRVWHASQLHAMFDDFFWNSFLGLLVSFSCFTVSENGFFHYLLCIPIYHCEFFLSISPLSLLVWFLYSLWLTLIPCYLLRHQGGLMLITTAHLLYILSSWYFFFCHCEGNHIYERSWLYW